MTRRVEVKLDVIEWTSDHQPGIVLCRLIDRHGREWLFEEKVPVLSPEYYFGPEDIPLSVWMGATAVSTPGTDYQTVTLDYSIEARDGTTAFELAPSSIRDPQ